MNLLEKYLSLKHRFFFEELDLNKIRDQVISDLSSKDINGIWVYLCHSDPIKFVIAYLAILDRGGFPICLASDKGVEFDSLAFVEGKWLDGLITRKSDNSMQKYAVPTSGTTGKPKLCEFLLENAMKNATAHALGFAIENNNQIIQALPVHHSYGIIAYILTPLVVGCAVNFCPGMIGLRSFRKDKNPVESILHVSPSQARFIIRDKVAAEHLKKITIGGGALSLDELEKLQDILPHSEIFVSYGLTEAGPRVTAGKFHRALKANHNLLGQENWIGYALKDVRIKMAEVSSDESGRLCIQSPYLKINPALGEVNEGWLQTRDRVLIDGDSIFFLSREDDLLKYGGVTIYPKDIETVVRKWNGVTDVIVLKDSDAMYGDIPLLIIEGQISLEEAHRRMAQEIPQATAFKDIFIQSQFPRQSLEKIDRKKLLDLARSLRQ